MSHSAQLAAPVVIKQPEKHTLGLVYKLKKRAIALSVWDIGLEVELLKYDELPATN